MQKLYFFILLFFLSLTGNKITAQTFQYDWTDAHGEGNTISYTGSCWGSSYSYPCTQYNTPQYNLTKLASDQSGNIFHAGRTNRPFDINSGAGTNMITPATYLYNSGYGTTYMYNYANFIAKQDNNGVLQWAGNIKALTGNDNATIVSITPIAGNYLLVAGAFYGTVNFDINGTNSQSRTTSGSNDIFFAKYNSLNGDLIWVKTFGGTSTDYLSDFKTDNLGNIILAGYTYSLNLDVNPEAGISLINSAGATTSFIIKYDIDGNFVSSLERAYTNGNTKIGVDSGNNIYELSSYSGTRDLNGTTGIANFTANGTHTFVSKYSSSGNYLWTKEFKRDNNTNTYSNPIDFVVKNDHLYFVLSVSSSVVDVNPDPLAESLLSSGGYGKTCIVEWDSDGNHLWNLFHNGNFNTYIDNIDVNNQGEISFTERDYTGYDVDPTSGVMNLASGNAYWTKLNADHSINYVAPLNFPSSRQFTDIIYDNRGSVFFGGNSSTATANLNSADLAEDSFSGQNVGSQNYFITKYMLDCPTPAPTADAAQIFCNAATVGDLSATGTAIKWYASSTLGSELPTTTALVSGMTYYASQTLNSCESTNRTAVTVTINTTAAPTATATQSFCNAATIANLSATGTAIKWYAASTLGSELPTTTALVSGTTYYASQTLNSCQSTNRTAVTVTINTTAAPTATATQSFCNAATIANLSATGTAIKWYDGSTLGSELPTTTALVSGTTYYASQTLNSCESTNRTAVAVTIHNTAAPTATAAQSFCNAATIANLSATGTAIKWYASSTLGSELPTTTALVSGTTYYVSQTLNSCESTNRTAVTVTINTTAAPTATAAQSFCNAATIANLSATGTAIKWYASSTLGSELPTTTALVSGTTYYASQTLNSCESTNRTAVTVTINTTAAPTATATQSFCNAAIIANLSATGTAIKWYAASTLGSELPTTTALVSGTTYYASQTLNSCESTNRTAVAVTINTTAAPTATAAQSFCNSATIADLSATGTAIKWYAASTLGSELPTTTALVSGTTYYASQTLNSCESTNRTAVTVTINTTAAPTATATQSFCNAATIANLSATGTAIKWYASSTLGSELPTTTALVSGTTYYASQTLNSCESTNRTAVTVTINTTAAPTATAAQSFCNAATIANLSATGTAIKWYASSTLGSELPTTTALVSGTTYYASQTLNSCESTNRTAVTVTINTTAAPTATAAQSFCNAATIANLSATGTAIKWYASSTLGSELPTTTALVNGTTYYASQTLNSCESTNRTAVMVTINATAAPTATAAQSFCNAATIANLSATGTAIKWYAASTLGSELPTTTALVSGTTYYASQTLNSCESTNRTAVTVTINTTAAPTATATQSFCNAATIANLSATGTAIKWYASSTLGSELPTTTALVSGTTYYASQTLNSCESTNRTAVAVTINTTAAPTGNTNQEFCNSAKIADLTAVGSNIQWFVDATGSVALNSNTTLVNGIKYYASQTINGCQSASRLPVTAIIKTVPVPTGPAIQQFCSESNPTLSEVNVNSNQVVWYDSSVNGNILSLDYRLTDGEIVYAGNYDSNTKCESSSRLPVTIKIIDSKLEYFNLISVNGNDLNSKLKIKGIDNFPVNTIEIFNRYGNLVWKTDNYNNENNFFDGKSNSKDVFMKNNFLPTGTYYFVLKYRTNCKSNQLKGFLQIDNNQ